MRTACIAALLLIAAHREARADAASLAGFGPITATTGAGVYQHVCQGCHMPGGKGAVGAASIPALAHNPKLAGAGYPVYVITHGYGAMPWFNGVLTDKQIADVVNYVRGNFGNTYTDTITATYVAARHGPPPTPEK